MGNVKLPHGYGIEKVGVKLQVRLEIWKLCWGEASLALEEIICQVDIMIFLCLKWHLVYVMVTHRALGLLQVESCGSPRWTTTLKKKNRM